MKRFKKLASLLLAVVMVLAMSATAFAATITIDNAKDDEEYVAYKIFEYTSSGVNYSYRIAKDSVWVSVIEAFNDEYEYDNYENDILNLREVPGDGTRYLVEIDNARYNAADFAEFLSQNIPSGATGIVAEDGVITVAEGELGYYFVTTTTGALCSLVNNETDQTLMEKNQYPSVEKKIVVNDEDVDATTATIDEDVNFKITVTNGVGTNKEIVVHDTMGDGFTGPDSSDDFTVTVGTETATLGTDYTVNLSPDDCTFEITLKEDYVKELEDRAVVVITYTAKLNGSANIASPSEAENTANNNAVEITYSNGTIDGNSVSVYTHQFNLKKQDSEGNILDNAKFVLLDNNGEEIDLVEVNDGYRVAKEGETPVDNIVAGEVVIKGLKYGTYTLKEVEAPAGYNLLTETKQVTIDSTNQNPTEVVVNESGIILPSTGGIGTTVFYAAGIVLMAGAVFFVVRSRRHE